MNALLSLLRKIPLQHIRVVRFLVAGGSAVALNIAVLWIATELLHVWYLVSAGIATFAGFIVSFVLHKFWTFEDDSMHRVHMQFSLYVILGVVNIALNALFVYLMVEYGHVWYVLAQVISIVALAISNFFIYRRFIFSRETSGETL